MTSAPSYSPEPGFDERRLGIAAQSSDAPATGSFGTLLQRGNGISIALKNQQGDASRATYGRNASVAGEVSISSIQGVTSVQVNLEGKVTYSFGTRLPPDLKLLHLPSTLWEAGSMNACPAVLAFGFVFPETFIEPDSGESYQLPPSYDPLEDSISFQDMHIRCVYRLSVILIRSRWMPNKSMTVELNYAPRTAPPRAIMDAPFPFFDTIKSAPEEWYQMSAVLPPTPRATVKQVHCQLFTPSVRIFTKRDMVPFFLQLHGERASMMMLFSSDSQTEEGIARRLLRISQTTSTAPQISISIKRQVVLRIDGSDIARSYIIGTGSMRSVPPGYVAPGSEPNVLTVDYEGEIPLAPHVTVGGFDVGRVRVLDSIVLSVQPVGKTADHFSGATLRQPIRIVTG